MSVNVTKLNTFTGHRDSIYTLQRSGEVNLFFSGAGDGLVVLWDMNNPDQGQSIAKLTNSIYALHFDPDRDLLIAGHNYEGIHLLDWKNKKEIGSLQMTKAAIFDMESSDRLLFVATGDGTIISVDIDKLLIVNKIQATEKSARTMAINHQSGELAVGYSDNYIRVFDIDDMRLKYEWLAHSNSVFTVRYTPDGNYLLSGSRDARLKVWDVKTKYLQAAEVVAHLYAINHLDFSPDGKHFVTCSMDKSIKVWDAEHLKLLKVIDKARHAGHGTSVNKLFWTSHKNQLLSASDDRTISSWNIHFETTPI